MHLPAFQNALLLFLGGILCMTFTSFLLSSFPSKYTKFTCTAAKMTQSSSYDPSSLLHLTLENASKGLQSGRLTSVDLVEAYLARIEEASEFNAILQVNPEAVSVAQHLDEERSRSGPKSPLHGIPILVKDSIATKDKLDVSASSYALFGAKPALEPV
ncbi:hypothetical protein ONS96_013224 [Cadophora gregata f. sp. sojae]|nr:hypothetical protein ONS96_013224 [Cadophora gregata f. sp. sojae]